MIFTEIFTNEPHKLTKVRNTTRQLFVLCPSMAWLALETRNANLKLAMS